jgi:TfoX/Sxy family transcriptional regulator of competence genes
MAYNTTLANRIRAYLSDASKINVEERKMFRGLTFMVNGKMCVNVSHDNLMCRFDPNLQEEVAERIGFQPMVMKGRECKGYCYVTKVGYKAEKDFKYWLNLCVDFNGKLKQLKSKQKS